MKNIFILLLFLIWFCPISAQKNTAIALQKGQVFDVLPLKLNKNADSLSMRKYLNDSILPKAIKLGYIPIANLPVKKHAIQGNYTPDVLVLGAWKSKTSLDAIMKQLETEFSDFHSLRREIWTVFYNTHYELKEDLKVTFLSDKFYVATAYWKNTSSNFKHFKSNTATNIKSNNGKVVLELTEGNSPYGYYYNPDYFFISEWNNKADFEQFLKENQVIEKQNLKHINQFNLNIK